ncbi:hypothetical protein N7463_001516 [Penicillium fimorum]|uniref:SMP-30/Gluconolactonase/LRE-like region domain-containing protein n=1 Tax=Penicillium fimorum TaxID=1882269 RepID=A0A9W9Y930_9EURO|nr:hypothetical protein N7463_001516 [Penicillium fimorum]
MDLRCLLGEAPYYDQERREIRWLDINRKHMHFVNLDNGPSSLRTIETDSLLGVTANIAGSDNLIAAGKHGFATVDRQTGTVKFIAQTFRSEGLENVHRMRMNDGAVDKHGRFWAGAMPDSLVVKEIPPNEGSLWRLDHNGSVQCVIKGLSVPNGIGWNRSYDTMYVTDSIARNIYAFDFDLESGRLSNRRIFFHSSKEAGLPDGLVVDEQDFVWTALFFGGKILRISPMGEVVTEIMFPCSLVTCPVFVGTELFVTTACHRETTPTRYGGCIFRIAVGISGQPPNLYCFSERPSQSITS